MEIEQRYTRWSGALPPAGPGRSPGRVRDEETTTGARRAPARRRGGAPWRARSK
ncbi:hypothetical protein [Nocardioides alkalitolerans]|uniref:hypothetical protein n=1 Tax=Nocardioides alkalitolerans TaxID=281714 RepID=UPI00041A6102|nr:hypothetical protein [Nocardioides alkalitolerans]